MDNPDSKIHGANVGPTWAAKTQVDPMLATWTLLSRKVCQVWHDIHNHIPNGRGFANDILNALYWMKAIVLWLKCHLGVLLRVPLVISQL